MVSVGGCGEGGTDPAHVCMMFTLTGEVAHGIRHTGHSSLDLEPGTISGKRTRRPP